MDAHDTHAVGAFVLDEQRERVEQSQHQFYMTQRILDISDNRIQFYEVVMIEDAELSQVSGVLYLLDLSIEDLTLSTTVRLD